MEHRTEDRTSLASSDERLRAIAARLHGFFDPEGPVDIPAMLFVAGLQALGRPARPLTREEKTELIHIGACAVLAPYGYYRLEGRDERGFPHYEPVRRVEPSAAADGELLKEALIKYFDESL